MLAELARVTVKFLGDLVYLDRAWIQRNRFLTNSIRSSLSFSWNYQELQVEPFEHLPSRSELEKRAEEVVFRPELRGLVSYRNLG